MTGRDLRSEVVAALADKPLTASELALTVRARKQSIYDVLAGGGFVRAETPSGGDFRKTYWQVAAAPSGRSGAVPTGEQRLLAVLRDGRAHRSAVLYRRLGVMVHSRVAVLRKRGYQIECWRDGSDYFYRLVDREQVAA